MPDYLSQDMEMCPWPKKHFCSWNLKQMEEKEEVWEGVGGQGGVILIFIMNNFWLHLSFFLPL